MPFFKAGAATGGCCVLSNEHRMISKWSLLPIIGRVSGSQALVYELRRMLQDGLHAVPAKILLFLSAQLEARSE